MSVNEGSPRGLPEKAVKGVEKGIISVGVGIGSLGALGILWKMGVLEPQIYQPFVLGGVFAGEAFRQLLLPTRATPRDLGNDQEK